MKDYEKIASPTHVPPLMLKIVAANLALWLIVLPLALAIRVGLSPEWLTVAVCGVPLAGAVILGMFISRLIAFGYFVLFWFWQGLFALAAMAVGALALAVIIFQPARIPESLTAPTPPLLPDMAGWMLPGAMIGASMTLGIVLAIWLWRRGRADKTQTPVQYVQLPQAPVTVESPAPKPKELSYLNDWQGRKG